MHKGRKRSYDQDEEDEGDEGVVEAGEEDADQNTLKSHTPHTRGSAEVDLSRYHGDY